MEQGTRNFSPEERSALEEDFRGHGNRAPRANIEPQELSSELQGEELSKQLDYWTRKLSGLPVLELPTDHPRPRVQRSCGAKYHFSLGAKLIDELKALGQGLGATLDTILLSGFQVLLARYSRQNDIAVGSPVAGRTQPEWEGLIGFFGNTLVLRTDLSGEPSFCELVKRVRWVALEAFSHQELPFEKLVEELLPDRDLSHHPLVQVMFVFQNAPRAELNLHGLTVEVLPTPTETSALDLILFLTETPEGELLGSIEYDTDLFEAATIERLAGHFRVLLEGATAQPDQPISRLPLLSTTEREQLLSAWNATAVDYPRQASLPELFTLQVANRPKAPAVVDGENVLSYGELNVRANRLAHYLRAKGVGSEVPVALCLDRSADAVVAILAILKAGGAYVPLDPAYPLERLAFMLADSGAPVLVTEARYLERLPPYDGTTVYLDKERQLIARSPESDPDVPLNGENLAYIIYTSGSTGTPKGVAVPHRAVIRLVCNVDYVQIDATQTFALLSPISFDASTFELWAPLLNGGRCIVFPERIPTIKTLDAQIRKNRISVLWLTAGLFNAVVDEAPEILTGVQTVITGGEALSPTHVRRALQALPGTRFINGYGPTESTTFACCYQIPRPFDPSVSNVPIGRPISNTAIYILDEHRQPVPIGVAGELYIGGDGLARGYWRRPELTAERFVSAPFSEVHGLLYRTGDLARYRSDGTIEYLGRIDNQIKLRGFRIELGEIEAALCKHPQVKDAVVTVHRDSIGDRLIAYCVCQAPPLELEGALRHFLAQRLPEYMVPATYVFLDQLPLTPNGKIDHKALPAPLRKSVATQDGGLGPRDRLEFQLLQIWERLLRLSPIEVDDDFFSLGGHSLLGIRVVAEMEKVFGQPVPLTVLYQHSTIRELANFLRGNHVVLPLKALVPVQPMGTRSPFFFVYGLGSELAPYLHPDQPVFSFNWLQHGYGNELVPNYRVPEIATSHLQELRSVQPKGPYRLGGFSFGGVVALEMAHQLRGQGEAVEVLALVDPPAPAPVRRPRPRRSLFSRLKGWSYWFLIMRPYWKMRRFWEEARCRYYVMRGQAIPPELNIIHLQHLSARALTDYKYPTYPHGITLYIPETEGAPSDRLAIREAWAGVATESLEIRPVEGALRHRDFLQDQVIRKLADELNSDLS